MGSVENPPLYALLAVLALMATIALAISTGSALEAIASPLKHRSSAPRMVFLTCATSVAVLLAVWLLVYATFFVHWTF